MKTIQDFINQDKMLPDSVLIKVTSEIGLENSHQLVEELDRHGCIHVRFGCRQKNDVFVGYVDETSSFLNFFVFFLKKINKYHQCSLLEILCFPWSRRFLCKIELFLDDCENFLKINFGKRKNSNKK